MEKKVKELLSTTTYSKFECLSNFSKITFNFFCTITRDFHLVVGMEDDKPVLRTRKFIPFAIFGIGVTPSV